MTAVIVLIVLVAVMTIVSLAAATASFSDGLPVAGLLFGIIGVGGLWLLVVVAQMMPPEANADPTSDRWAIVETIEGPNKEEWSILQNKEHPEIRVIGKRPNETWGWDIKGFVGPDSPEKPPEKAQAEANEVQGD